MLEGRYSRLRGMDDNLPAFTLSSKLIAMTYKVFHIPRLITSQGIHHCEQFARDGHQRFDLGHTALNHARVGLMHNSGGFHCVNGRKIEQFSHQWSSALGNPSPAFVLAGADFKQIKTGQFGNLSNCPILAKVPDLANQSSHGDQADTWKRKKTTTVEQSTIMCKFVIGQFLEEWQVLGNFSYRL